MLFTLYKLFTWITSKLRRGYYTTCTSNIVFFSIYHATYLEVLLCPVFVQVLRGILKCFNVILITSVIFSGGYWDFQGFSIY